MKGTKVKFKIKVDHVDNHSVTQVKRGQDHYQVEQAAKFLGSVKTEKIHILELSVG